MKAMELKVWVDGVQRIVCGVTEFTTCQEVVIALAQAIGTFTWPATATHTATHTDLRAERNITCHCTTAYQGHGSEGKKITEAGSGGDNSEFMRFKVVNL